MDKQVCLIASLGLRSLKRNFIKATGGAGSLLVVCNDSSDTSGRRFYFNITLSDKDPLSVPA